MCLYDNISDKPDRLNKRLMPAYLGQVERPGVGRAGSWCATCHIVEQDMSQSRAGSLGGKEALQYG